MWQGKTFIGHVARQFLFLPGFGLMLAFLAALPLCAQPAQPVRLELEASANTDNFQLIPLPDSSLLVFKQTPAFFTRPGNQTFTKYDSRLSSLWTTQTNLPEGLSLTAYHTEEKRVYLLFVPRRADKISVLILNTETVAHVVYEYQVPEAIEVLDFQVLGNYAFLSVHDEKGYVRLLHVNLSENEGSFLPAVYAPNNALSDFRVDPEAMRAEVVLAEKYGNKTRLQVRRFMPNGELASTHFVFDRQQQNLQDGRLLPGDSTNKMLAGTYANRDQSYHQGLFTTILNGNEHQLSFYNFVDFKRFFDYMAPRTRRRIQKKIARLKSKNKDYLVRSKILLHKPVPHHSGFYLIAEAYAIQYNYQPGMDFYRQGAPQRVFNGYRRTAAIVCSFNKSGELIWENSYPVRDITTYELYPTVSAGFGQDSVYLAYFSDSRIKYKSVYQNAESPNDREINVQTYQPSDKISSSHSEQLVSWYGAHFVAYGFQRIKPENQPVRQVFYINKISFENQEGPEQP